MKPSKLHFLAIDDKQQLGAVPSHIKTVKIRAPGIPRGQIDSWDQHCSNLALVKEIEVDLLSIDINFERDDTDPQNEGIGGGPNCSGLYHAMMILARRQHTDEIGNRIPLVWEIRSAAAPDIVNNPHLQAEVTRAYGLLRALLAKPNKGESLEECLVREYNERHRHKMSTSVEKGGLIHIFQWELKKMPFTPGANLKAVNRLLPMWRTEFLRFIERGEITLDTAALASQIQEIQEKTNPGLEKEPFISAKELLPRIPLAGWTLKEESGLSLFSVMADFVDGERLDVQVVRPASRLASMKGNKISILGWLKELERVSRTLERTVNDFRKLAKLIKDWADSEEWMNCPEGESRPPDFWTNNRNFERCFIYGVLLILTKMRPDVYGDSTQTNFATTLCLKWHERLFLRPFKEAKFGRCTTPRAFGDALSNALYGRGTLFSTVPWLKDILYELCAGLVGMSNEEFSLKAPSLLPQQDH